MNGLNQVTWRRFGGIIVGLAIGVGAIASGAILAVHNATINDARQESLRTATQFAQAAETWIGSEATEAWIHVDARRAFQGAVEMMLLGTATYVQLVHEDTVVVDAADVDWSAAVPLHMPNLMTVAEASLFTSANGKLLADVVVPLEMLRLEGQDIPAGYARVGFDLAAVTDHLKTLRLAGTWIAFAVFLVSCVAVMVFLAWLDHRGVLVTPFRGVVRSLAAACVDEGPLVLDEREKRVMLHGKVVSLPPKPFELLCLLVRASGRVLEEKEIVGTIWPEADLADSRDVRQCVYLLRKRIDAAVAGAGACIANVKGFGYRYDAAMLEGLHGELEPEPAGSS